MDTVVWDFDFKKQVAAHDLRGPTGLSYQRHGNWWGWQVDCLLYRDETGSLVGVHYHYAKLIGETLDEVELELRRILSFLVCRLKSGRKPF